MANQRVGGQAPIQQKQSVSSNSHSNAQNCGVNHAHD